MFERQHRLSRLSVTGIVLLSVALAIIPFVATTTGLRQASQIIISVLAVLGVNVATGVSPLHSGRVGMAGIWRRPPHAWLAVEHVGHVVTGEVSLREIKAGGH